MSRQPTQAVLSNPHKPELGVATVPLPIPMKEYDRTMELLKSLGIGAVFNQDCHINGVTGEWASALHSLKNQSVNVDELDYLIKRLESFWGDEPAQFMAMADKMNLTDMVSLINLTFCCQKATVITDFNNLEEAGRQHYMNLNNGSVPIEELERLDGRATALQLIKSGEGFVTPYGVVFDNGMALEVIYDGKTLPPYLYEKSPLALTAKPSHAPKDAMQSVWLALPMSKQQLDRALLRGGMFDTSEAEIEVDMDCLPSGISERFDLTSQSIEDLNAMCAAIASLTVEEQLKLSAAVGFAKPNCALQVRNLANTLDMFDFVPGVKTPTEYAKHVIQESGHFEYDENLEDFYDYEGYGTQRVNQEGGTFTEEGYIAFNSTISLEELMGRGPVGQQVGQSQPPSDGMTMGGIT